MTQNTKRAVNKYGHVVCVACYQMWVAGEGANTIGNTNPYITLTTRQADAAIAAGRELSTAR